MKVILGNPPYSAGQKSANDNNQNIKHPKLEKKIQDTYFKLSKAQKNNMDSYKKAIRFATDRIEQQGIVSFITNASFLDSISDDGLRKSLAQDFDKIYIFNLRGNKRTSGETARKEGGGIFGSGSRTPTCIFILVKRVDNKKSTADIYYYDIGNYLKEKEKLKIVKDFGTIKNLPFKKIIPNKYVDWLNMRCNENYENYYLLGDKKNTDNKIFLNYTCGVKTNRDSWVYNFVEEELIKNVKNTIDFYNSETIRLSTKIKNLAMVKDLVNNDTTKISWSESLHKLLFKKQKIAFNPENIRLSLYRPFCKQYLYFCESLNERQYQIPNLMPQKDMPNIFIGVVGKGAKCFSPLITNITPDNGCLIGGGQWFPLYSYDIDKDTDNLTTSKKYHQRENISDEALNKFRKIYSDPQITKENIFYYIYGLLHAKDYQSEFFEYITREIPRIPFVKNFKTFKSIGEKLADLHLNYEATDSQAISSQAISTENIKEVNIKLNEKPQNDNYYYVDKMRFGNNKNKSIIIYNQNIRIENIPLQAYEYVVNGRSAIEWIIDRYQVKQHPDSKLINNPNYYQNSKYIFDLLLKVIILSIKSVDLINQLPKIEIIK